MTRKSERELERAVDDLDGGDDPDPPELILYEDPETGELRDADGGVVPLEEADPIVILPEDLR